MEIDAEEKRGDDSARKLNASDARHVLNSKRKEHLFRQDKLKRSSGQFDEGETIDLRAKLNSKFSDLREKLKRNKTDRSTAEPEPVISINTNLTICALGSILSGPNER
ncbi:Uncharacterized protein Rs2_52104 [Raphanus sativus]|nr:Uncharacterized protein Rs2_52104 [Raphanus sativus]